MGKAVGKGGGGWEWWRKVAECGCNTNGERDGERGVEEARGGRLLQSGKGGGSEEAWGSLGGICFPAGGPGIGGLGVEVLRAGGVVVLREVNALQPGAGGPGSHRATRDWLGGG